MEFSLVNDIIISLEVTPLANFFAMLIALSLFSISFLVFNYKLNKSFYALLLLLTASLLLIVYAADYLLFFIGWEIMSITTYLILSFSLSKKALIKYIVFAMASALSLLIAILILYSQNHSFLYADARNSFELMSNNEAYIFTGLMLFAFFVKMGTIGFHYWLVDAYEESLDIFSAFLSAIVSKMGVYALIIFVSYITQPIYLLAIMGVMTSVIATFKAIQEDKIKRLLAYSSIAQVGYIITVVALSDGMAGALYHSLLHTLVKLLLFINVAGVIVMTNRDKFSELGGLIYRMPQSFVFSLIGIIALAGVPPLSGFASKFMIYTSLLDAKFLLILSAMMFSSASAFLYVYKLIYGIYLGHPSHKKLESAKETPISFLIPQYLLSSIIITLGFFPALVVPYFNTILSSLDLKEMEFESYSTLITSVSSYNGTVVFSALIGIFLVILIGFTLIRSKAKNVKDRFDIAYCGEKPNESTHLHYGYGLGKELKRVGFIAFILRNSSKYFYEYLAKETFSFAGVFRKIYSGNISISFNIAVVFLITLLWWSLK